MRLTLDRLLQHEAARILAEQVEETDALGGVIIISIPRTGEILAMVSADRGEDGELHIGYRNRALTWVFEPGSVMKALTFSAVLDRGLASPATVRNVPDQLWIHDSKFSDYSPHPPEDYSVHRILVESSNIGTIQWAQQLGQKDLYGYLRMFGLGSSSGLGLEGESRGLLEQVDRWSGTSLPTIAIGQGVSVTPIQLLFAYNAIANYGYYVPPKLVEEVISPIGESTPTATPLMERQVVSGATSAQLRAVLRDAVLQGTGKRAQIPNYEVAGKTGTARKPLPNIGYGEDESEYKYVATFAGFLPASAPEISLLVVIDEPTSTIYGGTAAAPAFKEIAEIALRRLRIPPSQAESAIVLTSARNNDG